MARLIGEIPLAAVAMTAGTSYQLFVGAAPANQRVAIKGWYIGNNYNTNGTPGLLSFGFATSAGSGGSALTPVAIRQGATETFQSTWSSQPSSAAAGISAFRDEYINPQIAAPQYLPDDDEIVLKGGGILVVTFTPQVSCSSAGWLRIEE